PPDIRRRADQTPECLLTRRPPQRTSRTTPPSRLPLLSDAAARGSSERRPCQAVTGAARASLAAIVTDVARQLGEREAVLDHPQIERELVDLVINIVSRWREGQGHGDRSPYGCPWLPWPVVAVVAAGQEIVTAERAGERNEVLSGPVGEPLRPLL